MKTFVEECWGKPASEERRSIQVVQCLSHTETELSVQARVIYQVPVLHPKILEMPWLQKQAQSQCLGFSRATGLGARLYTQFYWVKEIPTSECWP